MKGEIKLPKASSGIQKGVPLKLVLNEAAVHQMMLNISYVYPAFPTEKFKSLATNGLEGLEFMPRAHHIAKALRETLPSKFSDGVEVLIDTMIPLTKEALEEAGTGTFYFLPYSCYLGEYGLSADHNEGEDPFPAAMRGIKELTKRFTSEWAIRNYLLQDQERTLAHLMEWIDDPNTDVRRFVSEGTRPILPWGKKLPIFLKPSRRYY